MSTFHQECPGCGRTLELPTEGKGRLGKCPACEATFTIGQAKDANANAPLDSAAETSDDLPSAESPDPPVDDSAVDRARNTGPFASAIEAASTPPLRVTETSIEDIWSTTLAIFTARWFPCLASFAMVAAAGLFFIVLPSLILNAIHQAGAAIIAAAGCLLFIPFAFTFTVLLAVGFARVALAVARNDPAPLRRLIALPNLILRAVGVALLLSLVTGIVCIVMLSFVAIVAATGAKGLAELLELVAMAVGVAFLLGLVWQLWAWLFVCADDKGTTIGSLRAAQAITSQNKLPSFFIVLSGLVLSLLGTLMCGIGHLVTAPLTMLLFAVSYLMTTGQTISDPRDVSTYR